MNHHYNTPPTGEVTRSSSCSSLQRAMSKLALQDRDLLNFPDTFVTRTVDSLIDRDSERAGSINGRDLEAKARALIPSLAESWERFPDPPRCDRVGLDTRLQMERTLTGEPLPPVRV